MDLSTLRNEIDRIDSQLVQLYEQRMEICSQVAEYKIENGKKVFDKTREEEKLARVRSLTHNDFNSQGVTELFEQIMAMSRKLQHLRLGPGVSVGQQALFILDFMIAHGISSHI